MSKAHFLGICSVFPEQLVCRPANLGMGRVIPIVNSYFQWAWSQARWEGGLPAFVSSVLLEQVGLWYFQHLWASDSSFFCLLVQIGTTSSPGNFQAFNLSLELHPDPLCPAIPLLEQLLDPQWLDHRESHCGPSYLWPWSLSDKSPCIICSRCVVGGCLN